MINETITRCPKCGTKNRIYAEMLSKSIACGHCHALIRIHKELFSQPMNQGDYEYKNIDSIIISLLNSVPKRASVASINNLEEIKSNIYRLLKIIYTDEFCQGLSAAKELIKFNSDYWSRSTYEGAERLINANEVMPESIAGRLMWDVTRGASSYDCIWYKCQISQYETAISAERSRLMSRKSEIRSYEAIIERLKAKCQQRAVLENIIKPLEEKYIQTLETLERMCELSSKINRVLERSLELKSKKLEEHKKHGLAHAKSALMDKKSRSHAQATKTLVKRNKICPYCENHISKDAHLDHIYPVSYGGLSIPENMVYCCRECNLKKGQKGLVQFLTDNKMDVAITIQNLIDLGKKV